jgi:hypothetical protein
MGVAPSNSVLLGSFKVPFKDSSGMIPVNDTSIILRGLHPSSCHQVANVADTTSLPQLIPSLLVPSLHHVDAAPLGIASIVKQRAALGTCWPHCSVRCSTAWSQLSNVSMGAYKIERQHRSQHSWSPSGLKRRSPKSTTATNLSNVTVLTVRMGTSHTCWVPCAGLRDT